MLDDLTSPGAQTADRAEMEADALHSASGALETFLNGLRRDVLRAGHAPTLGEVLGSWSKVVDTLVQDLSGDEATRARLTNSAVPVNALATARATLSFAQEGKLSKAATRREMYDALDPATGTWDRAIDGLELRGVNWQAALDAIVRTEATAAQGRTSLAATRAAGYPSKMWVARHDSKTRPAHLYASGQTVPVDQDFIVGGYTMDYPGDPTAPPELTWNCRCVMVAAGDLPASSPLNPDPTPAPTLDQQLAAQVPDPDMPLADRVRLAVKEIGGGYDEYVGIETLRSRLADVPRSELDKVLRSLKQSPDVTILQDVDSRRMSEERRDAQIIIGGEAQHLLKLRDPIDVAEEEEFQRSFVKKTAPPPPIKGQELAESLSKLSYPQNYSDAQIDAMGNYQGLDYAAINRGLRGAEPLPEKYTATVRELDELISNSPPLADAALVYRGLRSDDHLPEGSLVGRVIRDKAFTSVTIKEIIANKFLNSGETLIEIVLPSGARAAPVNHISAHGLTPNRPLAATAKTFNTYEGELLLPRNSSLQVISEERRNWGSYSNIRVIRAEVIL